MIKGLSISCRLCRMLPHTEIRNDVSCCLVIGEMKNPLIEFDTEEMFSLCVTNLLILIRCKPDECSSVFVLPIVRYPTYVEQRC